MAPSTASDKQNGHANSLPHTGLPEVGQALSPASKLPPPIRVLGLGNDILADDAFGPEVAREAARRYPGAVEAVVSAAAGFALLDHLLDTPTLIVVDTIRTGSAPPGTLHLLSEADFRGPCGNSPHFVGLCDVLAAARLLGLHTPARVQIIAVEAADCETVGGRMDSEVRAAIARASGLIGGFCE